MNQTLKNKRALVTGGSRGIGAAIVKRLAGEGANVTLTYSNSPHRANEVVKAAQAPGVRSLAIQADSADATADGRRRRTHGIRTGRYRHSG